jgi:hypothetical protein
MPPARAQLSQPGRPLSTHLLLIGSRRRGYPWAGITGRRTSAASTSAWCGAGAHHCRRRARGPPPAGPRVGRRRRPLSPRDVPQAADLRQCGPGGSPTLRRVVGRQAGGQTPNGRPISHSWPNGSTTRPTSHPCSSCTGLPSVPPALTAASATDRGSSTNSRKRAVAPPTALASSRPIDVDVPDSQKRAPPTDICTTPSGSAGPPTRCSTTAPNACSKYVTAAAVSLTHSSG